MFEKYTKDRGCNLDFYIRYGNFLAKCGKLKEAINVFSYCFRFGGMNHDRIRHLTAAVIESILLRTPLQKVNFQCGFCCAVCQGVLNVPVTLSCGHTFCRRCVKDKTDQCPTCGSPVLDAPMETNIKVQDLVDKWWSKELIALKLTEEGNCFMNNKNDVERALNKYNEALFYAPENPVTRSCRSQALYNMNRLQEALCDANTVVKLCPLWGKAYHIQGTILLSLGQYDEALIALSTCLFLDRSPEHVKHEMTRALYRLLGGLPFRSRCYSLSIPGPYSFGSRLRRSPLITLSHPALNLSQHDEFIENNNLQCGIQRFSSISAVPENTKLNNLLDKIFYKLDGLSKSEIPFSLLPVDSNNVSQSDFECILCCRMLWRPVTTPCGHTYCWNCLDRCLDYSHSCPLCMTPLAEYMSHTQKHVTEFLDTAMQRLLPKEYSVREAAHIMEFSELIISSTEGQPSVPIFVCTTAFPHVPCPLFVYEPRYRVMVRRCIETGTRQFGMAACISANTGQKRYADFGTVLEIQDCVLLSDGCSILSTIGCKRFHVVTREERDGYDTAKIEYLKDEPVCPEHIPKVTELHERVRWKGKYWFSSLLPVVKAEVIQTFGAMPDVEQNWIELSDGPAWTWWLISILPLGPKLQLGVLGTTSLEKRLLAIDKVLDHINMCALQMNNDISMKANRQENLFRDAIENMTADHQSASSYMNRFHDNSRNVVMRLHSDQPSLTSARLLEGAS